MHYTLHLTTNCNFACDYCYVKNTKQAMTTEIATRVIDMALAAKQLQTGIAFFGGEPLLHKDLIKKTIEYTKEHSKDTYSKFFFKLTTNGYLLDEEFIRYCQQENIFVAISLDGISVAHNKHRLDKQGQVTYEKVVANALTLLKYLPNSPVMMTVNPDTVQYYAQSVIHLFELGFVYLLCGINYQGNWDRSSLREMKKQYKKLATFYYENSMAEKEFYLSPFETKIKSHVNNRNYCQERCDLGNKQISVAANGEIYPCVEFIGDQNYLLGDVWQGVDEEKRKNLYRINEIEKAGCEDCVIKKRCNHYCSCQNKRATGYIDEVSPILCYHEQMLLPIVDKLAKSLYQKRNSMFIQKNYNEYYPILSIIANRLNQKTNGNIKK